MPNNVYYDGAFENNKPKGAGTWYFNSGNCSTGVYEQKVLEDEGDDPPAEEQSEDAEPMPEVPKVKVDCRFKPNLDLHQSAKLIKEMSALE